MHITPELTHKLAHLARLGLTVDEVQKYSAELTDIIGFFEQLKEVDTEAVRPIAQITDLENVKRTDNPHECDGEGILNCSPNTITNDHIRVQNVF